MSEPSDFKVMVINRVPEDHKEYIETLLADYPQIEIFYPESKAEQMRLAPEMRVIVGREIEHEILEAAENLQMYVFSGTGVDELLKTYTRYSRKNEVILCNTHRSSYNCAQHIVAMVLSLLNRVLIHDQRMRNHEPFQRNPESIIIRGKTIGLLGYGPINQFVHQFLRGFDVKFAILKRSWKKEEPPVDAEKYTLDNLMEFMRSID
ncbi:MAG: NAD(P)-dependent oxidoreductase, partial [Candidatus Thorarchaeota archaeon]